MASKGEKEGKDGRPCFDREKKGFHKASRLWPIMPSPGKLLRLSFHDCFK